MLIYNSIWSFSSWIHVQEASVVFAVRGIKGGAMGGVQAFGSTVPRIPILPQRRGAKRPELNLILKIMRGALAFPSNEGP